MATLPSLGLDPAGGESPPDPIRQPEAYEGILTRRVIAYLADAVILAVLLAATWLITGVAVLLTFGLLAPLQPLVLAVLPIAYHTLLIGGRSSATFGMRLMGVGVLSQSGGRPTYVQAAVNSIVFYASLAVTGFLILVVALFNPRRRTLHDFLAGTVVVRRPT